MRCPAMTHCRHRRTLRLRCPVNAAATVERTTPAAVEFEACEWLTIELRDIGLGGLMFTVKAPLALGNRARLHTRLGEQHFEAEVEVRRVSSRERGGIIIGLACRSSKCTRKAYGISGCFSRTPRTNDHQAGWDDVRNNGFRHLIGSSSAMRELREEIDRVARSDAKVLDHRRERRRQGARRRTPSTTEAPAPERAARRGQLRRPARNAARIGAVRPRQGQLHRRLSRQAGKLEWPTGARCSSTKSAR